MDSDPTCRNVTGGIYSRKPAISGISGRGNDNPVRTHAVRSGPEFNMEDVMKISDMGKKKLERSLRQMFGKGLRWQRKGNYCFVHLDDAPKDVQAKRMNEFSPEVFFDPNCPHCRSFLEEGAIMVYCGEELFGLRMLADGVYQTVFLPPKRQAVAN